MTLVLALVLLAASFLALIFLPRSLCVRLLQLKAESKLWVRLIGLFGIVWVVLVLITEPELMLSGLFAAANQTNQTNQTLTTARNIVGGVICGLFLALYTQRFER